ncbi:MAG: aminodeoxychorismate/anthranilate synthase component II [Oligoflexales bacterium]|nr:aminodeoxychorismate/anthranilate synthase component II [Oligoflexales bacterium]
MRIAFIDHYDSFSFNLIEWLALNSERVSVELVHIYCDDDENIQKFLLSPMPLVISPGPKRPQDSENIVELVRKLLGKIPILGVCLGHQILAYSLGAQIDFSEYPEHGSVRKIGVAWRGGLFSNMPNEFQATVYNSLIVRNILQNPELKVSAYCENMEIQSIEYWPHHGYVAAGVQYHPESFLSDPHLEFKQSWYREVIRFYENNKEHI